MKRTKNPSILGLILCNYFRHNKKNMSLTGKVHYCSRCGIVTRDDRRQGMVIADASRFAPGMKITFGAPGPEYMGIVAKADYQAGRIVLSRIEILPIWRSKLAKAWAAIKNFLPRQLFRLPKWRPKLDSAVREIHRLWGK